MRGRGGPIRLDRTLRGQGELSWGPREVRAVAYAIDFYRQGPLRSAAGDLSGDFTAIANRRPIPARLRLEDGEQLAVLLSDIDAGSAMIELAPSQPAAASPAR